MHDALQIDAKDNVAVVIRAVAAGETLRYGGPGEELPPIVAGTDIPIYHKVSLTRIPQGAKIVKYGEHIGEAAYDIEAGVHVHTHNVKSVREDLSGDRPDQD